MGLGAAGFGVLAARTGYPVAFALTAAVLPAILAAAARRPHRGNTYLVYPGHRSTVRYPRGLEREMNPDLPARAESSPAAPHPAAPHPARLAVGVIGAGRAGTALGAALARAGHAVVAASAVSEASVRRARATFPAAVITDPGQVLRRADLVLLTVPDDVLPGLVAGLAATEAPMQGRMLAHASGATAWPCSSPPRAGRAAAGAAPGDDVHRARRRRGPAGGTCFGVTAPEVLRPAAEALVIEMGGEPVFIAEEHRDLYHAALAGVANHLITLVAQAAGPAPGGWGGRSGPPARAAAVRRAGQRAALR